MVENNSRKVEIMSPAGNFENLRAAIQGGADSIYFGVGKLNMRSRSANNFMLEDLPQIADICGESGIKTYLTLNTIMFDEDISLMRSTVDAAKSAGLTAVIASDQAVIAYSANVGVEIHLSTQINISNFESLRFYAQYADVAVLARELNLDQVKAIHRKIIEQDLRGPSGAPIRIEMFAHGALCMAVSGKCYLSLHEYASSANRGGCYQTCRRSYLLSDKETGAEIAVNNEYLMSPKDLCTISFIDKMISSGVGVLKIEGRARSSEYVKATTQCYREAVQAVEDGAYTSDKIKAWTEKLSSVFNRGFWDGYYLGRRLGEWSVSYGNQASKRKIYLGKITNYFASVKVAEILIESGELKLGDEIVVNGPTTGLVELVVDELRVEMKSVEKAVKGEYCSVKIPEKVRCSDKLYKMELQ
ncbi:MAG: U32 family peptidase [Prevotellaceae bacterium]|jgi:putative protease|nr:U32 family peptidase [Prevotellaceae bacterium]